MDQNIRIACADGDWNKFEELVKNGVNIHQVNRIYNTCLHYASQSGNMRIIKYLVDHGSLMH